MDRLEQLSEFRAKYRSLAYDRRAFDAERSKNPQFSQEIESLYGVFFGKFTRTCGNCWHDAFMRLFSKHEIEKAMSATKSKSSYRLLAGTCLPDPVNFEFGKILCPKHLAEQGDDLLYRHASRNPNVVKYIDGEIPADFWDKVKEYKARMAAPAPAEEKKVEESDEAPASEEKPAEEEIEEAVEAASEAAPAPAEEKKVEESDEAPASEEKPAEEEIEEAVEAASEAAPAPAEEKKAKRGRKAAKAEA